MKTGLTLTPPQKTQNPIKPVKTSKTTDGLVQSMWKHHFGHFFKALFSTRKRHLFQNCLLNTRQLKLGGSGWINSPLLQPQSNCESACERT